MRARDLMTRAPLTLPPDAPLAVVARALAERGVSGAPVVAADGTLLGIVTESDLIRRLAAVEDPPTSWLRDLFTPESLQAARFARTHGRAARDLMSTDLVTAEEDTPIERIAHLMEQHGIRRVPVLREGRLVGIVARADLVRALLTAPGQRAADAPDERIHRALVEAMRGRAWADSYFLFPEVRDGVVTFHGFCRDAEVRRALRVLAEGIPGVKEVRMDLRDAAPPVGAS